MSRVSRTARRIFRPVYEADPALGPVGLDLRGVAPMDAYDAIRSVNEFIRVTDAPSPLHAKYVFIDGTRSAFKPTVLDRIAYWIRGA